MFRFCSLYSGSSGNSLFVESDNTRILIDCGESAKKIVTALSSIDVSVQNIDAIIITHEHSDHIKSLSTLSMKYNIPVYATEETWKAMPNQYEKIANNLRKQFVPSEVFNIGNFKIEPFSIPHDAANPCGFNIKYGQKQISIATDLGHVTSDIINKLEPSSFILLESNYDPEILKFSKYPYYLKQRISGDEGHLSNIDAGKLVSHLSKINLTSVMLGHLSKENNFPELAYKTVAEELINSNCDLSKIEINVATRVHPSKIIEIA